MCKVEYAEAPQMDLVRRRPNNCELKLELNRGRGKKRIRYRDALFL
jgi:hypothetical protein